MMGCAGKGRKGNLQLEPLILHSQLHCFGLSPCQLILKLGILLVPLLQDLGHLGVQLGLLTRLLLHQLEGLQTPSALENQSSYFQAEGVPV